MDGMTHILNNEQIDRTEWTTLNRTSPTGTWFQSPEAYDFYASLPEVMNPFVVGIEKEGVLRAVCVGYETVERSCLKQFFTRRAIINGGPCLANDCTDEEVTALMGAVKKTIHSIYIETRNFNDFGPWREAFEKAGFAFRPHLNFHIDCSSAEMIETRLSDVRKRQIRRAIRNGATIVEASTEQEVSDWYHILAPLYRQKVKTPLFPWAFFLTFFRNGVGKYLLVKHADRVIGGIMCPMQGGVIYEWFVCGLDTDYHDQYPSVMATYAAMDYAVKHGMKRFDVMGAGKPDIPYGVRDFKAEFGGQLVEYGRFLYINRPLLYRIGVWGVKMLKHKMA